jgi:RimJ/RimL family protein N-acetyltransferase
VQRRIDGAVLGDCGLWTWADTGEPEIGWRFAPAHWGQRYASEAARAVFAHGRDEIRLRHLICMAYEENVASWRIAERLGFALDRREEQYGRIARRYVWTADRDQDGVVSQV